MAFDIAQQYVQTFDAIELSETELSVDMILPSLLQLATALQQIPSGLPADFTGLNNLNQW